MLHGEKPQEFQSDFARKILAAQPQPPPRSRYRSELRIINK
jgi:hypothetical protein